MQHKNPELADTPKVLEVEGVSFSYNQDPVLKDVSFHIHEQEMAAFIGPNGGGKTTLLKLVLGLLKPDYGIVRVFGQSPQQAHTRVGYVPQYMQFDPQFPISVLDVVRMGMAEKHLAGPYHKCDTEQAYEALRQVDMYGLRGRGFSDLSGGQRQRVLIARALASKPQLLLLDEPTANIDYMIEQRIYELLATLNKQLAVIIVSHDIGVVTKFVSTVVCVNRTVKLHPTSEFTGELLQEVYGSNSVMIRHDHTCSECGHEQADPHHHHAGGDHV